ALTSTLIMGSWMVIPSLAIYLVKNLHWPETELRWVWLVGGLGTLMTMTPTGWIADSRDKLSVFRIIGLGSASPARLATKLPDTSMPVIVLVTTLFMVCASTRWVAVMALITTTAAPHHRGTFMSVNGSLQQLAMSLASKISGLLLVEEMVV